MQRYKLPLDERDQREIDRALARVFAGRADVWLKLFGSRARGDARRASDIDLALGAAQSLRPDELATLREALEESCIPFRVDLVDYGSAPHELRAVIDREGIPWAA